MKNFCYHGIGTNLLKYESILEHGILTKRLGAYYTSFSVSGSRSYNEDDNISVVIPHSDTEYGAIQKYVFEGVSFLITDEDYQHSYYTHSYSGIFDEGYVKHSIAPSSLSGIIIPTHLRNKRISELPIIQDASLDSIIPLTQSVINTLVEKGNDPESFSDTQELMDKFETTDNATNLSFEKKRKLIATIQKNLDANLVQKIESYYQGLLGKEDINLMDVINYYNQSHLPIYDERDVEEQCKEYTDNIPQYIKDAPSHYGSSDSRRFSSHNCIIEEKSENRLEDNSESAFKKIAQKSKRSIITNTRNALTSFMNQLHEKNRKLR